MSSSRRASGAGRKRHPAGPTQAVGRASDIPIVPGPHVLRDYALLADGHRGVLVGPQGDCGWLCFPGWADPAVFATLIGSGGHYLIQPEGRWTWGGSYEDRSLIWNSRWVTNHGIFESREALTYPGEPDRVVLLRRVRALDTPGTVLVALDPRGDYGRRSLGTWRRHGECWEVRSPDLVVRWWGAADAESRPVDGHHRLELALELDPAAHHDLVLEIVTAERAAASTDPGRPDPERLWRSTEAAWHSAVPDFGDITAARDVRRAYAVLRGMTGPEGGTVAAATTSLPERANGNRNYDYRYVWIRDTCYVGRAGACLAGGEPMLDDAVRWVTARLLADGPGLAPAYLPDGGPVPGVQVLNLPGYPGGTDIVGNRIGDQFQLDALGEALLLLALAAGRGRLDDSGWEAAEICARAVEARWVEPDSGVWELEPRRWTGSRLICVAGLRAMSVSSPPARANRYEALADTILASMEDSLHETGRWKRAPDDERVDASLLLAQIRGAVPATDPRSRATRHAVATELSSDGYVYRYGQPDTPLGESEGAFLICNFWLSLAALDDGDVLASLAWFERGRSSAGSPGLLAEEFDVAQHQLRGNLPQAFVHALLIENAAALSRR